MKKISTEEKIEETLTMLDSIPKVKANPFFYTRLKAKMDSRQSSKPILRELIQLRFVLAVIGLILLIAVNTYSVISLSSRSDQVTKEQGLESFAETYNFTSNNF